MEGAEYDELKADIAQNGLLEAIWLHPDGSIIDGRNRHRACIETETRPAFRTWSGKGSLVSFVVSMNLHRRHLSKSQSAVVALDVLPMLEAEAKARMMAGRAPDPTQKIADGEAREQAAGLFHTNRQYVSDAKRLQQQAPDLLEQVKVGEKSIPQAKRELIQRQPHVSHNSGNNEWYTPPEYIAAAREVMGGIDLDPASSEIANRIVQAETYYTEQDDGLLYDWHGRVWMNPPYSAHLIGLFAERLAERVKWGDVTEACVLVNNATETGWFNTLLAVASCVCFIRGRVKFIDTEGKPSGAPLQGQAILYIGLNVETFGQVFSKFGWVLYAGRNSE
jgi:ParB family chromosome partitioning protein